MEIYLKSLTFQVFRFLQKIIRKITQEMINPFKYRPDLYNDRQKSNYFKFDKKQTMKIRKLTFSLEYLQKVKTIILNNEFEDFFKGDWLLPYLLGGMGVAGLAYNFQSFL